ncbi:hypothetical protein QEM02_003543 [Pseudomonas putida]|nr:hypothetical protein [Pseudomonas putida]
MHPIKTYYHPIDIAISWCKLETHKSEIEHIANLHPNRPFWHFPQWPYLQKYMERIHDAIKNHELPAQYLGERLRSIQSIDISHITVRHSDLRTWISTYFPEDKPAFLFDEDLAHNHCVSLGTYLIQKADAQSSKHVIEILQQEITSTHRMLAEKTRQYELLIEKSVNSGIPHEDSATTLYTIIGAMLDVVVGSSSRGQIQSIYKNQSSLVDALTCRFPEIAGLSKRTLDRKFAQARRLLAQTVGT